MVQEIPAGNQEKGAQEDDQGWEEFRTGDSS